jgi:ATP-dependent Zn protease
VASRGVLAGRGARDRLVLGRVEPGTGSANADFSEYTARVVDAESRELVGGIEKRVTVLMRDHRCELDRLAAALVEHETLERPEIETAIQAAQEPRVSASL